MGLGVHVQVLWESTGKGGLQRVPDLRGHGALSPRPLQARHGCQGSNDPQARRLSAALWGTEDLCCHVLLSQRSLWKLLC